MAGPGGLKSVYTGAMKHSQLLLVPLLAVAAVSVRRAASLCERQLPQGIALQLMPRQLRTKIQNLAVRIYYIDCVWAGLTGLSLPKFPTAP